MKYLKKKQNKIRSIIMCKRKFLYNSLNIIYIWHISYYHTFVFVEKERRNNFHDVSDTRQVLAVG